jgi:hypothetical protein
MAMHKRYEEAQTEYLTVEKAESQARKDGDESVFRLVHATKALIDESDALRVAILHQVPTSWIEAMVLQFHITAAFDMQAN